MSSFLEKKISELPAHIIKSDHYKNFREIQASGICDGDFCCSEDAYKENFVITTQKDLDEVIHSDSYFGYDEDTKLEILKNVHKYWLSTECPIVLPMQVSFFAKQVHTLLVSSPVTVRMTCMKRDYSELLKFAILNNFPQNDYFGGLYSDLYYAAANNSINCARIGIENGFEIRTTAFEMAVEKGNFEIIKMFIKAGFRKSSKMCKLAPTIEILIHLVENEFPWDIETTNMFAKKGNSECLEYAVANGCPISPQICENAAYGGNVKCMEIAFANSTFRTEMIAYNAVQQDHLEAFVYAAENGVPITEKCLNCVMNSRHCLSEKPKINITPTKVSKYMG